MKQLLILLLLILILNALHATVIVAADARTHTRSYRLDSGHLVRTWLDEPIGVWCAGIFDANDQPAGITCAPLTDTAYNWVIQ